MLNKCLGNESLGKCPTVVWAWVCVGRGGRESVMTQSYLVGNNLASLPLSFSFSKLSLAVRLLGFRPHAGNRYREWGS